MSTPRIDIRVTCTTRTYTLGGTVEGLVGTLQLRLTGGELLSVTTNGAFTFQTLSRPQGGSSDGTRLAVADRTNSRVLIYDSLPTSTGTEPNLVLGQPDFTSVSTDCSATGLIYPSDVFIGHGKVIVVDTSGNRVLIWNTLPTTHGAAADLVLGQRSFTTCQSNDSNGDGTGEAFAAASTLALPSGVWTDGTRLLVADTANSRVLLWNQFPTTNAQPADVVIGQPDFTSRRSATTANGLAAPSFVNSTGQQIFVADSQNNRVTLWNQFPTVNNVAATTVLGQADFASSWLNDPPGSSTTSARRLSRPAGMLLAPPYLVVSDYGSNRLLVFESR